MHASVLLAFRSPRPCRLWHGVTSVKREVREKNIGFGKSNPAVRAVESTEYASYERYPQTSKRANENEPSGVAELLSDLPLPSCSVDID